MPWFLGDPNDGDGKYEVSSPMTYAENLSDPMLLVHGSALLLAVALLWWRDHAAVLRLGLSWRSKPA